MIYDTFLYDGEEEMLKLRIRTLLDVVDCFVAVWGSRTFRGETKDQPLVGSHYFHVKQRNIYLDLPSFTSPELSQAWHRNRALEAIPELQPKDIVLIGDVDEIPDPANVGTLGTHEMEWYQHDTKFIQPTKWMGTVGVPGETILNGMLPAEIRYKRVFLPRVHGGWHLNYFFMDPVQVRERIRNVHFGYDRPEFTDLESIDCRMKQGLDLFDRGQDCVRLEEPSPYLPAALKASPLAFS
jgi:glycosyl transferase family 17